MIKQKSPFFTKTLSKPCINQQNTGELDSKKTRRSYLKFAKNPATLTTIINSLQKNVRQLKNFHQSLQKSSTLKMRKSSSLNEVNKIKSCTTIKQKQSLSKNIRKVIKRQSEFINRDKENVSPNIQYPIVQSTLSKNYCQNGSTMLSIHNADVDEVKKAYQFAYGKETTNIVDLYHFFRKNADKSIRFNHHGEISTYPNGQQSQDLVKSRQNILHKKSTQLLNVIIEDKSEKQQLAGQSQEKSGSFTVSKLSVGLKNPTMEEIFKGGCPDLANVYDFVKKRRISLKNYMNFNPNNNKENRHTLVNKRKDHIKNIVQVNLGLKHEKTLDCKQKNKTETQEIQKYQNIKMDFQSPHSPHLLMNYFPKNTLPQTESIKKVSDQKYYPSKSSKKSQKSSKKKTHLFNLDQNIPNQQIQVFNKSQQSKSRVNIERSRNFLDENVLDDLQGLSPCERRVQENSSSKKIMKEQKSPGSNSLDGCSISVKSSSRIIELDFIPLDL